MAHIVLLALAAAVFPLLLACVAIIMARPEPRTMLFAFYIGGLLVSVTAGVLLLSVFSDHRAVLGSTSSHPSPGTSIIAGLVAVLLAWLMASQRGRAELGRWRDRHPSRRARAPGSPSWAERRLAGASTTVAFAVGAAINLPGPFYVLALGDIASGGYSSVQAFGLVMLFNVVMFALLEVPLLGYLLRPERTAELVAELARWLNANGLRVIGWLVGAVGIGLIAQGVAAASV